MRARELVAVLLGLGAQVVDVDVARCVALHGDHFMPAMTALAGLVPWAETGMRQTCAGPRRGTAW